MRVELVSQDERGLDPEGTREPCQRLEQEREYLIANPGYRVAGRVLCDLDSVWETPT